MNDPIKTHYITGVHRKCLEKFHKIHRKKTEVCSFLGNYTLHEKCPY